jgi:hypothetical protein
MHASTKPMTPEEATAIKQGQPVFIEKLTVHGTYKSGVPFVREYEIGIHLHQMDRVFLNYLMEYPDPLKEPIQGAVQ